MKSPAVSSLKNKLVIYDSNCKVCAGLKDILIFLAPWIKNQVVAYKNLSSALASKVALERFRNEMALIDLNQEKTLYGPEGIGYIFSSKSKFVAWILRSDLLNSAFIFLYKTIAHNRYIIASPKSNFSCDCFPEKIVKYRLSYIAITFGISILLTALFGVSLKGFYPDISTGKAAMEMLLMAGTGWIFQLFMALIFLRDKSLDYIGHLGSISVVGLLILVPWMLFHFITGLDFIFLPILSVALSSGYMLFLHIKRTKTLEINGAWTLSWFLFLQLGAFFWIYVFHLN
ncbi:MAG TPA: hypothetical protein VD908_15445 [Cytophagales bacterium]|nr:hypothetical protein [Cytophagales bacterium]